MGAEDTKFPVRVFGLERSGTNLMEWVVINHFDPDYRRIEVFGDHPAMRYYGQPQSLKHTLPTKAYSDVNIVIYKPFKQWKESWDKYYNIKGEYRLGGRKGCTREVLKMYLDKAEQIGAYIVEYDSFIYNYEHHVRAIANLLGVELSEVKPLPNTKMGTNMEPSNRIFKG